MLLDYVSHHQQHLEESLAAYEATAAKKVLDTWFKYVPEEDKLQNVQDVKLEPDMSIDDIIDVTLRMDNCLVDLYKEMAEAAVSQEVKDLGTPFRLSPMKMSPDVDACETENAYEISVELPGMDQKDIELTLSDGMLTLKGEKKEEREDTKKDYHVTERRYGEFQRSFPIPDSVDVKNVGAEFRKGVLTVTLPKTKEAKSQTRKIEVKGK